MIEETLICVDVETAGPIPGKYAMLSIGACLVNDTGKTFYIELIPDKDEIQSEALAISGLDLETLRKTGTEPKAAMIKFSEWIKSVVPEESKAVFVALNAPFDWMFVNDYYHRYLGENPFGHSALDIKAYYMGQTSVDWGETSMKHLSRHFLEEIHLTHNALRDAQDQAEIFQMILKKNPKYSPPE